MGELIHAIQPDQWHASTPCLDWTVHRLVEHLAGKNLVFAAVLAEQPLPQRGDGMHSDQLAPAYFDSAAVLLDAFRQPGVLDRTYRARSVPPAANSGYRSACMTFWPTAGTSPRPSDVRPICPEDAAEASLAFARAGWPSRTPRRWLFRPARHVADAAPAIVRLVAFLGRDVPTARARIHCTYSGGMPLVVREDGHCWDRLARYVGKMKSIGPGMRVATRPVCPVRSCRP